MNRSEELCRLLRIEPIYTDGEQILTEEQYCQKPMRDIDRAMYWRSRYPDLTKPSNFVKLLDLLNAYLDIRCDCLMAVVPQIIDKAIFLVSTNSSRFIEKKDKFKKQAQQIEWEY